MGQYRIAITKDNNIVYKTDWLDYLEDARNLRDYWKNYLSRNPGYGEDVFIERKIVLIERLED